MGSDQYLATAVATICLTLQIVFGQQDSEQILLQPPVLVLQPVDTTVYFHVSRRSLAVQLDCEASGSLNITYNWTKNGESFDWLQHRNRLTQTSGHGTLVFMSLRVDDEGYYQCHAANDFGTAVSKVIQLKNAQLGRFPGEDRPFALVISELDELSLPCHAAPSGSPKPVISWMVENATSGVIQPLDLFLQERQSVRRTSSSIGVDPLGNLQFSSVSYEDALGPGIFYACNVSNMAGFRIGSRISLTILPPDPLYGNSTVRPLVEQFVSPHMVEGAIGQPLELACIYGGTPVPEVTWQKKGGPLSLIGGFAVIRHGMRYQIPSISWRDEGVYECNVSSQMGEKKMHTFIITVMVPPKFLTFRAGNKNVTVGNAIQLACPVFGIPQPDITWMLNGKPLGELASFDKRRKVANNTALVIEDTNILDTGTYQCNASNSLGYDVLNIYLKVTDTHANERALKLRSFEVVTGHYQSLGCGMASLIGTDHLEWYHDNKLVVATNNREVLPNGTLLLRNTTKLDEGYYWCSVKRNVSMRLNVGKVLIREATKFLEEPRDHEVAASENAIFNCQVVADPALNLSLEWWHNGVPLGPDVPVGIISEDSNNNSQSVSLALTISSATPSNSGMYTCHARTQLDQISSSAILYVREAPPTPEILGVNCTGTQARIDWRAFSDLRDPVQSFHLQYSSSLDPAEEVWHSVDNISAPTTHFEVSLTPGLGYKFRVTAMSAAGASLPSAASSPYCEATPDIPFRHPAAVRSKTGKKPTQLVVYWKPLPQEELHGPGFSYRVSWRRVDDKATSWKSIDVPLWSLSNVTLEIPPPKTAVVPSVSFLQSIAVKVEASNRFGLAAAPAKEIFVLAGEDVPVEAPRQLSVLRVLNSTTAVIYWTPVSSASVRGILKGYKLETWATPEGYHNKRIITVHGNHTVVILKALKPNYQNNLRVWAFNGAHDGPPSPLLTFSTLFRSIVDTETK